MNREKALEFLTIPNILCYLRLLGSPILVFLAWGEWSSACLGLFVLLIMTDWTDGKLAKLLKQETEFGARLDSVADMTFYACTILAVAILHGRLFLQERVWLAIAVLSYLISVIAGLLKYRRIPSYHTRMAKFSWLLVFIAVIAVFAEWTIWAVRIALLGVIVTNIEATTMTVILPRWRANVLSVFHARRLIRMEHEEKKC